ncbi:MAG: glycine reductase [Synergistaceae bacterium]|jgi:betaine reductase|nr:glycine reductase [Synergistaceae bacterium]
MTDFASGIDRSLIGEVLGEIVEDLRSGRGGAPQRIGLMSVGSEHVRGDDSGQGELLLGALEAMRQDRSIEVVMIGPKKIGSAGLRWIETPDCESDVSHALEDALDGGAVSGAVAMHYPFPLGTATIGRVVTPLRGREMLIASSTGGMSSDRVEAMVRNAICGIAVAKSIGIQEPQVGILNVDGASSVNRILRSLSDRGYAINFGESVRRDGGSLLRGNDLLAGAVDVCVTDTLTGNVLMKLFSSWNNGGSYETTGYGYGPSTGQGWSKVVSIISRASGAPVIAGALRYTADVVRGRLAEKVASEFESAAASGLGEILSSSRAAASSAGPSEVVPPPAEPTEAEIHGVDVLEIEAAASALWEKGVYAEASMGCTGPVVKVPGRSHDAAVEILKSAGYL